MGPGKHLLIYAFKKCSAANTRENVPYEKSKNSIYIHVITFKLQFIPQLSLFIIDDETYSVSVDDNIM